MTTVVNIKHGSEYDVYCGRPAKWSNPWTSKKGRTLAKYFAESRDGVCDLYEQWILYGEGMFLLKDIWQLKNKRLGCFCHPLRCHCDVLARLANDLPDPKFTVDKLLNKDK